MLSVTCLIQVFILALFQENFTLKKGGNDIKNSFAITFAFCIGMICYTFVLCFFFY